ncbi:MAG: hypothetical protein LC749_02305, partial [Actinobacteria bacterium]|nr:hypothetical protein [Actinomycetota bacterium]
DIEAFARKDFASPETKAAMAAALARVGELRRRRLALREQDKAVVSEMKVAWAEAQAVGVPFNDIHRVSGVGRSTLSNALQTSAVDQGTDQHPRRSS